MRWIAKEENAEAAAVREQLKAVLDGLKFGLLELTVSRSRGSVQVRVVIYNGMSIGTNDCTKVHRAIMPRLELAFDKQDIYLEVSSPGVDRLIKEGAEFAFYKGRGVRCYRTDITEWTAGVLESAGEKGITIKTNNGVESLSYDIIAKAKLDSAAVYDSQQEV
ncbi:MAG: ribosome assembly cofactor RimP [Treponema sp.]|jgi:ribosome maturation factor RimP|nr:ribosome assembly cofactor RimP [Treponema sp.]